MSVLHCIDNSYFLDGGRKKFLVFNLPTTSISSYYCASKRPWTIDLLLCLPKLLLSLGNQIMLSVVTVAINLSWNNNGYKTWFKLTHWFWSKHDLQKGQRRSRLRSLLPFCFLIILQLFLNNCWSVWYLTFQEEKRTDLIVHLDFIMLILSKILWCKRS
jgi:hypothetical protein